ncbi:gag-pol polyprotein [Trifolium medium]|uniref:Gag-pol polyprotein n=1 Tax=Trifolium medium TaxID=97028 RepID=A0A392NPR6_9FABA|nr:gag-pol polyprotein [Trifolium medium]
MPYFQYPYVAAVAQGQYPQQAYPMPPPQQPLMNHQQQQNGYPQKHQSGPRNNYERKNVHFDHVPMPYGQILPYLIQKGMIEQKPPYPPNFDVNARCDYHVGSPVHSIENGKAFKYKVQEFIDRKLLSFNLKAFA